MVEYMPYTPAQHRLFCALANKKQRKHPSMSEAKKMCREGVIHALMKRKK